MSSQLLWRVVCSELFSIFYSAFSILNGGVSSNFVSFFLGSRLVIGIYGLIVGVIIGQAVTKPSNDRENSYSTYTGLAHLCAGLCTGMSGLAAGLCIGIVGDYGVRSVGYRASAVTLFPNQTEREGYATIADNEDAADVISDQVSGSEDQNKLFVGMLIMLIFSEALAL